MDRIELVKILKELVDKSEIYAEDPFSVEGDPSDWHEKADKIILDYLNDNEISDLFNRIEKWYS